MHQNNSNYSIEQAWLESLNVNHKENVFEKIYLTYWEKLYNMAYVRTKDEDVSKDIVQDIFVTFWNKSDYTGINTSLLQYLIGILKFKLFDYYQSEKVKKRVFEHVYQHMELFVKDVNDLVVYKELEREMENEVDSMPENMRKSFLMKLENSSVKEIARELNLAEQTVYNTLSEAYRRLKQRIFQTKYKDHPFLLISISILINYFLTKK